MKKFILLACFIVVIIIVAGTMIASDQIILSQQPLSCHEKNSFNIITANLACSIDEDCINWISQNCGPENGCNNSRIICKSKTCFEEIYFKLDTRCV